MSLSVTYTESPNTVIRSARWNRNFDDVEDWANAHEIDASGVHGVTGNIVGTTDTQTLSNKIFDLTDVKIYGGYDLKLYSDSGTTLKASIDGATGNTSLEGTLGVTGASTFRSGVTLNSNDPTLILKGNLTSGAHYNYLKFQNNAGTDIFKLYGSYYGGASNTYLLPASGQGLSLGANGVTDYLTISTGGLVGIGTTLAVTGATTLSSTLSAGASTLASATITGAATIGTTLGVTGATTLSSTLGVTGVATFSNEVLLPDVDPPTANYANRNGIVKGWLYFTDASSVVDSYNVDSISDDDGDGLIIIFWDTDFGNSNYILAGMCDNVNDSYLRWSVKSATLSNILITDASDGSTTTEYDFTVLAIGDQ